MSKDLHRPAIALASQLSALSMAVPTVVAHRVGRMAAAGTPLSARDRREFEGMVAEKNAAFVASWQAMALHATHANQAMALSWMRLCCTPTLWGGASARALQTQALGAALGVLGKGLAPVRSKAVANAKRLGRNSRV